MPLQADSAPKGTGYGTLMVARVRVELTFAAYETAVLPLDDLAMVPPAVLEPACRAFQTPTLPSKLKRYELRELLDQDRDYDVQKDNKQHRNRL